MQCILYKIYFWKVFHMNYNLICIFICTPICANLSILVKSGCYTLEVCHAKLTTLGASLWSTTPTGAFLVTDEALEATHTDTKLHLSCPTVTSCHHHFEES
jgi:hypothetical protein